jgi:hypothetical protein
MFTVPDGRTFQVRANTKSEGRALLKPVVGLRRKDRLPVGTVGARLGVRAGTQPQPA